MCCVFVFFLVLCCVVCFFLQIFSVELPEAVARVVIVIGNFFVVYCILCFDFNYFTFSNALCFFVFVFCILLILNLLFCVFSCSVRGSSGESSNR